MIREFLYYFNLGKLRDIREKKKKLDEKEREVIKRIQELSPKKS
jgi:hypothetical protein